MDVAVQFLQARRLASPARADVFGPLPAVRQPEASLATPVAIGLLLLLVPPLAVTLVWTTPRFDPTARMALTLFGGLVTMLMALVAVAALN